MDAKTFRRFYEAKSKEELLSLLKFLHEKGYRYVIKEPNGIYLTAYKYEPEYDSFGYWCYSERDLQREPIIAYPIKTDLMAEIRTPKMISDILWPNKTVKEPEVKNQLSLF